MKPQYQFFKNFAYAREGFREVYKKEKSFRLQVWFFVLFVTVALFLPLPLWIKPLLVGAQMLPVMAELLNSAVERVVDLVTSEYHELAKYAKDAAAAGVMISIFITASVWIAVILYFFT